ncbi:MAG TPA: small ribosomal subunit Rsm22 family protein, partial [Rhabdochlamydiaceae bacterium]|nr:small ribosomal subunit Rsm22 family protein [Rhabdochlamydiaceae bacterium]
MEFSQAELKKAAQALSERYRTGSTPYLRSRQDRYAYLLTRFPATKAALHRVFQEIRNFPVRSMLDIGAGPGTAWEAAQETWSGITATLIERDRDFVEIGSKTTPTEVRWVTGDVSKLPLEVHDLVLFSYSWGEILDLSLLERAWQAAGQFLVVVEPGTPRGY